MEAGDDRRDGTGVHVTVCACTCSRLQGLRALLRGLASTRFREIEPPKLDVVIADNEGSQSVREICEAFERSSGIPLTYVYEPRHGLAHQLDG